MMRLLIFAVMLFSAAPSFAQTNFLDKRVREGNVAAEVYSSVHFEDLAARAIADRPKDFSFRYLRMFYLGTPQYQPTAEDVVRQMITHAYVVQNTQDWIERDQSLGAFHELVRDHLANIGVVEQALSLSRQDERFGDPGLYEWVIDGLLLELLDSGDGTSPRSSYKIITMEEESYLLREMGLREVSRQTSHKGIKYYDIIEVDNPETGEGATLFVDATRPARKIEEEREKPSFAVDIGKQ